MSGRVHIVYYASLPRGPHKAFAPRPSVRPSVRLLAAVRHVPTIFSKQIAVETPNLVKI